MIICFLFCLIACFSQTIINPVFDRTDIPAFRVEKVEITQDTTYIYCLYSAEDHSWASISKDTYVEDENTGEKYPILKSKGIPFSPEKREFEDSTIIQVLLYFPHFNSKKINLIEDNENEAFNIYGINLNETYDTIYFDDDLGQFFDRAKQYEKEENWESAIVFFTKQLDASNYVYGLRSKESSFALFNLLLDYVEINNYDEGIKLGERVIDILNDIPKDSLVIDVLARTYGSMSTLYRILKQEEKASYCREESIALRKMKEGVGAINYEEYLQMMANSYYYEKNYPKAVLYGKELASIYEREFKTDKQYGCVYINALTNLCEFCRSLGQFEEAVKYATRAKELVEAGICGDVNWLKYFVYINYAGAILNNGQPDTAIGYLEKIIAAHNNKEINEDRLFLNAKLFLANILLNQKQDTINAIKEYEEILKICDDSLAVSESFYFPEYPEILQRLHKVYNNRDDSLSFHFLKKEIQFIRERNGDNSISYANLLIQYVSFAFFKKQIDIINTDSLITLLRHSSEIIKRHINNSVFNMSKSERELYWQRYKQVFTWLIPTISSITNNDSSHSLAYDASLFYKGMLLSSEREFRDIILSNNDSTLNSLYSTYIQDISLLETQYSNPIPAVNMDSLKYRIRDEEFLLSQKVSGFNRLHKGTNFSWEEVRDKLKDDEIAIEIVSFNNLENSNIYYQAYVINKQSTSPKIAYLFDETSLIETLKKDSLFKLSINLWGNPIIYEAVNKAKTIFFSASGMLNTIGIEYLPIAKAGGLYMNDRFNMVRLSSTRELCLSEKKSFIDNVYLYGGLDYDNMKNEKQTYNTETTRLTRSVVDSIVSRGGFEALVGSKEEIEQVNNEMLSKGIKCHSFTGSDGTETSFMNLSGKRINIIHLSTHGMYVPINDTVRNENIYKFVIFDNTAKIDKEDQALSHSFLVMSGGNTLLHDDNRLNEIDDGILTALEVSHLDFSSLDLVVLSACQTALGSIDSDGVYGLQRGFKKAGAHTILMSLDKVDDEATKILMVEFYKNLVSGKTKHQSLKDAQKYLRHVDSGKYDKPEYWASFIMLDGLN